MHFYDARFVAAPTTVLRPPDATVDEYRELQRSLGIERVVIVQPTTYGFDNSCQFEAAVQFGDAARLVVIVDEHTSPAELERLDALGARGARFHMLAGAPLGFESMLPVAEAVTELGWHVQLQMNGRELGERLDLLESLPCPLVVDHVGRFMPPPPPDDPLVELLLRLIDSGRCWVKLSAPYESTHDGAPHYPTVTALARRLVAHAPERLLWATNWPHPGQDPLGVADLLALRDEWLPTEALRRQVLVDNPSELYGFGA
jgi:D-galactarolactone isomerase